MIVSIIIILLLLLLLLRAYIWLEFIYVCINVCMYKWKVLISIFQLFSASIKKTLSLERRLGLN